MTDDTKKDSSFGEDPNLPLETAAPNPEQLQEELTRVKNEYLYLRAEFDNYRRQATKERSDLIRFAGERLAKDLLETLDIFEAALENEVTDTTYKNFVSGIELTAQQLRATLNKHHISEVPSLGAAFDPHVHEALGAEPSETVASGHITRVFKKPYKFHDKIIRPGQVIVAKEKDKSNT